jgi:pimeloyl-ACP methyl ester carboxylesterase
MQRMAMVNGLRIAYDESGAGDLAVVLLHGTCGNRTYYAAQAQHLAGRHRVLSIDLRGHGESDVPETGYCLDVLANDVIRVCEVAGVTRAVFCGHSMAVALKVVVKRPDLAAGVVLLDGVVLLPPAVRERQAELARILATDAWRGALLEFFSGIAAGAADRVCADVSPAARLYAEPLMRDIASSDRAEELAAVRCPLMYVHGSMPLELERLRVVRPDAIVEEIPNVGHWVMLTARDQVNAMLDRYLQIIDARALGGA